MDKDILVLTNDNFKDEILNKKGFSLVDFWAPWCGPCRMMMPIFEELSHEMKNVNFCKVNVDENSDIANSYRVSSIPYFILFKDGKAIVSRTGGTSKENLQEWIIEHIKK